MYNFVWNLKSCLTVEAKHMPMFTEVNSLSILYSKRDKFISPIITELIDI